MRQAALAAEAIAIVRETAASARGSPPLARVDGVEWSRGTTADMHWSFEALIAYISRSETLHPGDFIGSGTCSGEQGRGRGLEHGRYLEPGDEVELEVERLGVLRNRVVAE